MKLMSYALIGIFMAVTYFVFMPLFALALLILILYIVWRIYDFIQRMRTPHGKRIKHTLLRGYLSEKYGRDGGNVYKDMVKELKKHGYR
jgi:hypothetical protein